MEGFSLRALLMCAPLLGLPIFLCVLVGYIAETGRYIAWGRAVFPDERGCCMPKIFTLAHRSICFRCVNLHFEVSKNSRINFFIYIYIFYVHTQVFKKKTKKNYGSCKKDKF
jgi:hypothetical protein